MKRTLKEQLIDADRLIRLTNLQNSIYQSQDIKVDFSNLKKLTDYLIREREAKIGATGKAKILKLFDCYSCPFIASSWTRAKGDIFICTNPINQDGDGYCP